MTQGLDGSLGAVARTLPAREQLSSFALEPSPAAFQTLVTRAGTGPHSAPFRLPSQKFLKQKSFYFTYYLLVCFAIEVSKFPCTTWLNLFKIT